MRILAHRGFWKAEDEKNTIRAFERAFVSGYGIETDIRDCCGELVISHNPAVSSDVTLRELFALYKSLNSKQALALNIKADGLYLLLRGLLDEFDITRENYFLFDASVPEQYVYLNRGYRIFTRSSEFEPNPAFWEHSDGVWLDQFTVCGHMESVLDGFLHNGKTVCLVSPELHGRDFNCTWSFLASRKQFANLLLCTDKPDEAEEYFK